MALLVVPSLIGRLLFGEELTAVAIPVARVTGISLLGLAVACWPGPAQLGMLIYSAAAMVYLAYVGFATRWSGVLLWPAVIAHGILTVALAWAFVRAPPMPGANLDPRKVSDRS